MITPILVPAQDVLSEDTFYCYHYWKYEREVLQRSIREHGIQTPLLLEKNPRGYRIVHGFRRFECATVLGMEEIPGIVSEMSGPDNLKQTLIDNRTNAPYNIYEQSQAISVAHNLGLTTSQIISEILPLLDLNAHKNVYDDYAGFHRLPDPLVEFFVDKDIAISRSLAFQRLDESGLNIALDLLENFSPGINVLHEIVTNLYEISRREEKSLEMIYAELSISKILEEHHQPHKALHAFREQIHAYRYPVLSETNRTIAQLAEKVKLEPSGRIQWDRKLERRGINITLHWDRVEDVQKTVDSLSREENITLLRKIFKKI